jgi:hypothetical protein
MMALACCLMAHHRAVSLIFRPAGLFELCSSSGLPERHSGKRDVPRRPFGAPDDPDGLAKAFDVRARHDDAVSIIDRDDFLVGMAYAA